MRMFLKGRDGTLSRKPGSPAGSDPELQNTCSCSWYMFDAPGKVCKLLVLRTHPRAVESDSLGLASKHKIFFKPPM